MSFNSGNRAIAHKKRTKRRVRREKLRGLAKHAAPVVNTTTPEPVKAP